VSDKVREGDGTILKCDKCDLIMQDLYWSKEKIKDYYDNEYQVTNSLIEDTVLSPEEHFNLRGNTIQPQFSKIKPLLKKSMNVLEVGCGSGEVLAKVKPYVTNCVGIELNEDFSKFVNEELKIKCYSKDLLEIDFKEKFDLVICITTLDHMQNPLEELIEMKNLLKSDGSLFLALPNMDEALLHFLPEEHLKNYRQYTWKRAHFFYFTPKTITAMLESAGFTSKIDYYHQYTFKNYLKWYYLGKRQSSYDVASNENDFLKNNDPFVADLNSLSKDMNNKYHELLNKHGRADTMVVIAKPVI
tara:strand:+ start:128 stop:1030 length:903 start_codon:yes stop_codon:yes gene_type:complete